MNDLISREAAINAAISADMENHSGILSEKRARVIESHINTVPHAQPEPLSDAYTKAVWTWLLDYQIKAAELKGRYTPYEVLSWVANDWRKEHE